MLSVCASAKCRVGWGRGVMLKGRKAWDACSCGGIEREVRNSSVALTPTKIRNSVAPQFVQTNWKILEFLLIWTTKDTVQRCVGELVNLSRFLKIDSVVHIISTSTRLSTPTHRDTNSPTQQHTNTPTRQQHSNTQGQHSHQHITINTQHSTHQHSNTSLNTEHQPIT